MKKFTFDELMGLDWDTQSNCIHEYSVEELESFAVKYYDLGKFKEPVLFDFLDMILIERKRKLDLVFEWTQANRERLLLVNDKLAQTFQKAYDEALSLANSLELEIANGGKFLSDYAIDINMTPYFNWDKLDWAASIEFVLSEPLSPFPLFHECVADHEAYGKTRELPCLIDRSLNWNIEALYEVFQDDYIGYGIYYLMDSCRWSFIDIVGIDFISVSVDVSKQHHVNF